MVEKNVSSRKMVGCAKVLLFTAVITAVMLMGFALVCYKINLSQGMIAIGVLTIYVIATFIGGFFIGKCNQTKKYLWGMVIGLSYFVLLMLLTLLIKKSLGDSNVVTIMVMCIGGGMIGGMLS